MTITPEMQADLAVQALEENKGLDITRMDVKGLTNIADYVVICTATSSRQAQTLADKVSRKLRDVGVRTLSTSGLQEKDDWVLVDLGDVIVHIMLAEAREFYSIETLWTMTRSAREQHEN